MYNHLYWEASNLMGPGQVQGMEPGAIPSACPSPILV